MHYIIFLKRKTNFPSRVDKDQNNITGLRTPYIILKKVLYGCMYYHYNVMTGWTGLDTYLINGAFGKLSTADSGFIFSIRYAFQYVN